LIAASAMAAGCPVLGSDVPGIAAVVESGRSSVLLPPGDLSAWSAKLAEFVQHPDRIGALAQATRPTLPTMTEHVRRLDILYQDVMKRRT
jgi:glycosyltransferase involved in cell wall biosynthesis